jgi:hypothetical protein
MSSESGLGKRQNIELFDSDDVMYSSAIFLEAERQFSEPIDVLDVDVLWLRPINWPVIGMSKSIDWTAV